VQFTHTPLAARHPQRQTVIPKGSWRSPTRPKAPRRTARVKASFETSSGKAGVHQNRERRHRDPQVLQGVGEDTGISK